MYYIIQHLIMAHIIKVMIMQYLVQFLLIFGNQMG